MKLEYFKIREFDSPDEVGSGDKMNTEFLEMLDCARSYAGIPFKINSGYRTKKVICRDMRQTFTVQTAKTEL